MAKYIDVEPLIKDGWQLQRYNSGDGYVNQQHASLKDIPAADVRPVRRGRWEIRAYGKDGEDVYCSACECGSSMPYWPFCPMCGADMRGGDAE